MWRSPGDKQIAEELVLSECTVENHVSNILKKLKLTSRTEVAAWVEAQPSKDASPSVPSSGAPPMDA
jgi:FixJ family two-component response regulator